MWVEIFEALNGVGGKAAAPGAEEFAGDDADVPAHSDDADSVVAHGADGAGHVGTVPEVVHGVATAGNGVYAVDVVDVAKPLPGISPGLTHMLAARSGWL